MSIDVLEVKKQIAPEENKINKDSTEPRYPRKIVIVGLPNTGKSQVFNNLTGEYSVVANYPLTTVEIKRTQCRIGNQFYEVVDTPGLHCLYIHSEEELIVRDMIFSENPDIIIQCIDANRLKQSLTLTADLLELQIPMVVSLNAIDETSKKGIWIDSDQLSSILGVPVVESIAINGQGTKELKNAIKKARKGKWTVRYGDILESARFAIESELPDEVDYKRKMSVLLLLQDQFLEDFLRKNYNREKIENVRRRVDSITPKIKGNPATLINRKRSQWIDNTYKKVLKKQKINPREFSQVIAQLCRHPIFGIPILLMVLSIVFYSIVNIANITAGWMGETFWAPIESQINNLVSSEFWKGFLIGDYGVLTLGVSNALLTVLPILSVFFLLFNILEDIGYIPNLCVLVKRFSEKIGLSGSALLPITLAFGCKTMATLTTKSLSSKKERFVAIYLIAFGIPCAAQMGLNMSILGRLGVLAFLIVFSVLAVVWISVGMLLNKILKDDQKSDFIQELPDIRLPSFRAVLKKTYYKLVWFLKEAMPIFISAALILFIADKTGILNAVKHLLQPLITGFLGFPLQMVDVLILSMAKHEAAAGMMIRLVQKGQLNYVQTIVAVSLTMMFVPCLTNIVAIVRELGIKKALVMVGAINTTGILVAGMLNWLLIVLCKL
jgi:ferrous iron transport protein B